MSEALYHNIGGLRFWNEKEVRHRQLAASSLADTVKSSLRAINRAWTFHECEGPILTPIDQLSGEYSDRDLWMTDKLKAGEEVALRPETTPSSYAYALHILNQRGKKALPLCVYQEGKSFRAEQNDGASAAKLRFYEFRQLEFQCIYPVDTKADYASPVLLDVASNLSWLTAGEVRVVESDRLPHYSSRTVDIVAVDCGSAGRSHELCSVSMRTDFNYPVLEVAIGLDRVVSAYVANIAA